MTSAIRPQLVTLWLRAQIEQRPPPGVPDLGPTATTSGNTGVVVVVRRRDDPRSTSTLDDQPVRWPVPGTAPGGPDEARAAEPTGGGAWDVTGCGPTSDGTD
ncbi:hypothetical protein C1701_03080 [Actinoalloteichus sp. AHMU CJ021]|uniref:hypothetical protein n=1 Tax=Actinoalloteichus TaxID=65496 RepID=UPI000382D701|nr:hypothetical protein [Actinoalloteichus spitiensis]AUS77520.1 hypothetical protein C1701_03080 [Actinoalloteichus sp. AHMU CJ021]